MDPRQQELKDKLTALLTTQYGGDFKAMFDHYDANKDGQISMSELIALLADAGIGFRLTRQVWASAIIDVLDADHDDLISWAEFEKVLKEPPPQA